MAKLPNWFFTAVLVFVVGLIIVIYRMFQEGHTYLAGGVLVSVGLLLCVMALGNYFKDA